MYFWVEIHQIEDVAQKCVGKSQSSYRGNHGGTATMGTVVVFIQSP